MISPFSVGSARQSGALAAPHRILYVISTLDLGGAERHLTYIAPQMLRHGISPVVFSLNGRGVLAAELEKAGVAVRTHWGEGAVGRLPRLLRVMLRLPLALAALLVLIIRLRPHVIHMFLPAAYLLGGIAAMITRTPLRVMSRRSRNHYQRKHPIAAKMERVLHRQMSALLGNSQRVVADLREEGGDESKICLLYNGVPLPEETTTEERHAYRVELGIEPDVLVMTITANLLAYKGHADLLDALSVARDTIGSRWVLLCAGSDRGILTDLKMRAEAGGIASNVRWLGSRQDVPQLLAATDIGILCSHEEGFSNAVLEYMGAGLPTVVTDVGGNSEAIIDGICGLVVPPRDVGQLAAALVLLATDPARRAAMGSAARERIERNFTLDVCVEKYRQLYGALLNKDRLLSRNDTW
jgi:glycosyltransferase involved in cell wall biosynthesis